MIVCSCNVLSDREIRDRLASADRVSVAAVFRHMGCEAKCGRCVRSIVALVEQHVSSGEECAGSGCGAKEMAA
jgi:bacterioferritin-associated ferredoxin